VLEAEGEAAAIRLRADAQADALRTVAAALGTKEGADAAVLALAKEYVTMYGEMGAKSNTMLFAERPGDTGALIAQATAVLQSATHAGLGSGMLGRGPSAQAALGPAGQASASSPSVVTASAAEPPFVVTEQGPRE
jgi:hypothetical protein